MVNTRNIWEVGLITFFISPYLVVLMTCHHHEANVRRREWALEERDALSTWESDASLVRRLAHRAHPNPLVIEHNTHLIAINIAAQGYIGLLCSTKHPRAIRPLQNLIILL